MRARTGNRLLRRRRLAPVTFAAALVFSACAPATPTSATSPSPGRSGPAGSASAASASAAATASPLAQPVYAYESGAAVLPFPHRTVYVQMFEWKWTDVAAECERWLGPHGFAAVQVSPPNESVLIDTAENHFPWWQRYQPVSYKIESRSGTRAEFAEMVKRCQSAGVAVYADVILNHMASGSGTGNAGTVFTTEDFPGLYSPSDFHDTRNPAFPRVFCDTPMNTGDPTSVQTCELSGLPDLRTEEPKVQETLASYLADLYGLGVRGFRIDAAKHIDESQLAAILGRLRAKLPSGSSFFVDQEVTDFGGDAVPADQYYPLGSVDDFVYAVDITTAFMHIDSTISTLAHLDQAPNVSPSANSVVFVSNHDTERGRLPGIVLNYKRADLYTLANVFALAYPLGYPRIMSGYDFTDTEAGPPSDDAGHTDSIFQSSTSAPNCGLQIGQWVCEERWLPIAGMVGFRDFTADSPSVTNWWSNPADGQQIAFGRGGAGGTTGFVVINRSSSPLNQTLQTGLPAATYCDVIGGELLANGACSGATVTIGADGTAGFTVPPMSARAIHVGARRP